MHYVILADHAAHECPMSSAKTKALMVEMGPQIPKIAEQSGVTILAGPFVTREHLTVAVMKAEKAEDIDRFVVDSRLQQWNRVRIIPALTLEEGMKEMDAAPSLY